MNIVDLDKLSELFWDGNYMEIHKDDIPSIPSAFEGMTNGEVIKALLKNSVYELEITEIETDYCEKAVKVIGRSREKNTYVIGGKNKPLFNCTFKAEWWNAPYKTESEGTE